MSEERYCPTCEAYRPFRDAERPETYVVRGRSITANARVSVCEDCGETMAREETDDDLLRRVNEIYRDQEGLLSPADIKSIRRRYALSQKSFARLLGTSEATINRYEQGKLQDRPHDELIRACKNPETLKDLFDRRGDSLSELQRSKVEAALAEGGNCQDSDEVDESILTGWQPSAEANDYTGFRPFDFKRYVGVVITFCRALKAIPQTKLNKLLFYADFLNCQVATVSLTGSEYRKVQRGPVPAQYDSLLQRLDQEEWVSVEERLFANGFLGLEITCGPAAENIEVHFTAREEAVLSRVIDELGPLTAKAISDRSHNEQAWKDTCDKSLISYSEAKHLSLSLAASP